MRLGFESKYVHRSSDGTVLHESPWLHNSLADEGEKNLLDAYLRGLNVPSSFYLRLFADTPVETDSLASLTGEPGGLVGYAQQIVERSSVGWPTLANEGGDFVATSKTVRFNATGAWPNATHSVLSTSSDNTGLLIDYTELSQPRPLVSGDVIDVYFKGKMA